MAYPTRVRYGLRLLVRLATLEESRISMSDIALSEGVSIKYLEQIVSLLKPLQVLESVRGARGGYRLALDPAEISMERIFECLGGLSGPVPCLEDPNACSRKEICSTKPFWESLDTEFRRFLRGVSLADVVASAPKHDEDFLKRK